MTVQIRFENHITEARLRACGEPSLSNIADIATVLDIGSAPRTSCSWLLVKAPPYLKLRRKLDRMLFTESLLRTKDLLK